jgi:hypothetical protein
MSGCCGSGLIFCGLHTSPSINSVLSNAPELRLQSRHVIVFPLENRPTMTSRDGASEVPHTNEGCKPNHCGTPWKPLTRGLEVAGFNYGSPTDIKRRGVTCV